MSANEVKYEKLLYEVEDGIAVITMNYAKNLNAIDEKMAEELVDALDRAGKDSEARVIVIKGQPRAFSAGGDVGYFYNLIQEGGDVNMDDLIAKVGVLSVNMKRMDKIIISSVSGVAAGAGVGVALGADFMFCSDDAKFMLAFVNLGLVPDTGCSYLLIKNIGAMRTMKMAATGAPVKADEMKEMGLAYDAVPADQLDETVMNFAKRLSKGPLKAYANIKKQIARAAFDDYEDWLKESEAVTQASCVETEDFREGCAAFIEKRKAQFNGK